MPASRKLLLANDLVMLEDNCNLSCRYCLTGQSNFKSAHALKRIFEPPRRARYAPGTDLKQRADGVLDAVGRSLRLPILKVTGGEVLLIDGIMELLRDVSGRFATVVLQSNGSLLGPDELAEIKRWGNTCLQISLDAVSYDGNSYRCESVAQHERLLARVFAALDAGIPTEIYTVLHDRSLPALEDTLRQLGPWRGHVVVCPFPVRGPDRAKFYPPRDQIEILQRVLSDISGYGTLLPPRPYLVRLLRFFEEGERRFRCHVPRFVFTTFDDGTVTPCPNIWFNSLGDVLRDKPEEVIARIGEAAFYQILLADRPRIDACKGCFTPWDLLSMYVDAEITLDELCRIPMYAAPESRRQIEAIVSDLKLRPRATGANP